MGGAVYDDTGGYSLALAVSAAASAVAVVCTLLIRETRHPLPSQAASPTAVARAASARDTAAAD